MKEKTTLEELNRCWRQHIDAWKNTSDSGASFCRKQGLNYYQFVYWRRKFSEGKKCPQSKPNETAGFSTVMMKSASLPATGLTLSLPNGLVIRDICESNIGMVRHLLEAL
jgi:hypothetical protein